MTQESDQGPRGCHTPDCRGVVLRPPPCIYCEDCCYEQMGEEIERRPIGAVYASGKDPRT